MDEDRAAAPGYARPRIVVDFNDEIVKAIIATEAVAWSIGRPLERPIIAPIGRIFAPRIVRTDGPDREPRHRPRQAIGAPPQPYRVKSAGRSASVAFPFVGFDAASPQRDPQRPPGPGDQPSL